MKRVLLTAVAAMTIPHSSNIGGELGRTEQKGGRRLNPGAKMYSCLTMVRNYICEWV